MISIIYGNNRATIIKLTKETVSQIKENLKIERTHKSFVHTLNFYKKNQGYKCSPDLNYEVGC